MSFLNKLKRIKEIIQKVEEKKVQLSEKKIEGKVAARGGPAFQKTVPTAKKSAARPAEIKLEKTPAPVKAASAKKEIKKKSTSGVFARGLVKPVVSEKASYLSSYNQYAFVVDPKINKIEIKKAIENIYGVKPIKINIMNVRGKQIRHGRSTGVTKGWKKAVVTLKPEDKIKIYEGV